MTATYFLFAAAGGLLQGMGRIGDSARAMVAAIAINAALDPILLYGFSFLPVLGLPGIAISGVLARTCGFALQVGWYLRRPPLSQATIAGARSGEIVRDILQGGLEDAEAVVQDQGKQGWVAQVPENAV